VIPISSPEMTSIVSGGATPTRQIRPWQQTSLQAGFCTPAKLKYRCNIIRINRFLVGASPSSPGEWQCSPALRPLERFEVRRGRSAYLSALRPCRARPGPPAWRLFFGGSDGGWLLPRGWPTGPPRRRVHICGTPATHTRARTHYR